MPFFMTEQEAKENGLTIFNPDIPLHEGLCENLPLLERATFILYLSRFTLQEIGTLLNISKRSVNRYVTRSFEKYPNAKRV